MTIQEQALKRFGPDQQIDMAIEECAELIVALKHHKRGRATVKDVAGEIADVWIMVEQLRKHFGTCLVDAAKAAKLTRLAETIRGKDGRTATDQAG